MKKLLSKIILSDTFIGLMLPFILVIHKYAPNIENKICHLMDRIFKEEIEREERRTSDIMEST